MKKKWKLLSVLCILALLIAGTSTTHSSHLAFEDGGGPMVIAPKL